MRARRVLVAGGRSAVALLLARSVPVPLHARVDTSSVPSANWRACDRTLESNRHSPARTDA
jgi:hypothetical protein